MVHAMRGAGRQPQVSKEGSRPLDPARIWQHRAYVKTPTHLPIWSCLKLSAQVASHKSARKAPGQWILPTYGNTDCWKDFEPGALLGKGTFGTTYLAVEKKTGQKCAVKVNC